jgi:multidrug efflux pump subunit AcrA (membrane-fusion protein)
MRNVFLACSLAVLAGCGKSATSVEAENQAPAVKAAEFKKGQGLLLTPEAVDFIGLRKAEAEAKSDRVTLPVQALLRTSEGVFVFVANGQRWLRAPVQVGAESAETVEIKDGVLEGDMVAVAGVRDLWLAELQAIKGGVGCADGH